MSKYLPSKKFLYTIASIIVAVLIILGVKTLAEKQITKKVANLASENQKNVTIQEFMAIDSDSDGLKDWEEALWKTDPKNSDTDTDGTTDGEEVKINRDPLKKGPGDEVNPQIIAENKKEEAEFAKLTDTEKLARTFFSQYIASKGNSVLSSTNKQIILDTAIAMTESSTIRKYVPADLKISADISTSTIKTYGNTLGQAFFTGTAEANVENEVVIMAQVVETNNEETLKKLDPIIESYSKTIDKILIVSVPRNAVIMHLNFLNDLEALKSNIQKMKLLFSDPVQAMTGISEYQKSKVNLLQDLEVIKNYFTSSGIVFASTEYGYLLVNVIQ